jgi:hypothetical protein
VKHLKKGIIRLSFWGAIILLAPLALASPANWLEVIRFTGPTTQDTDYFTCTHAEWRLNWSYNPDPSYPQYAGFAFATKNNLSQTVNSVYQSGNQTTSGLTYVHDEIGQFYLSISTANLLDYTIIVEQDIDSIPEFPLGSVFALLAATLVIAILARRVKVRS